MIKIYCEVCNKHAPLLIEDMKEDTLNRKGVFWGDLMCSVCRIVIATITTEEEYTISCIKHIAALSISTKPLIRYLKQPDLYTIVIKPKSYVMNGEVGYLTSFVSIFLYC